MKATHVFPLAASLLLLAGCSSTRLERSTPDAEGVHNHAVMEFTGELENRMMNSGDFINGNANSFMLLKNGKVIAEAAWAPYELTGIRQLFSLSKSFSSTAIGFAVQEKLLGLDDTVVSFFPDKLPEQVPANLARMKVRDLLSMQSGHEKCVIGEMFDAKDMVKGFLATEVKYEPGTHFVYNNGATFMLSAIITKVTGEPLLDYLKTRLFKPLGVAEAKWDADDEGINFGAWGLHLSMESVAKFGQFCLQRGTWNGKQLLNREWFELATSKLSADSKNPSPDWHQGYGFQFWRCQNGAYRGDGFLGQYMIVMEKENAVLVMFNASNRMQIAMDVLWEKLYPGLEFTAGRDILPENLKAYLEKRVLEFPEKADAALPAPGTKYRITLPEKNELEMDCFEIEFLEGRCRTIRDGAPMEFGLGQWLPNPAITGKDEQGREFPVQGPLRGRAFRLGDNDIMLVLVSPDCAIQNFFRIKLEKENALLEGRFNWSNEPAKVTGKIAP